MKNKVIIFLLGVLVGAFVMSKYPFRRKTDVELVKEKLEEFYGIEEICGKGNVRDRCKYGYCNSELGLTCFHWHRAAREAEEAEKNND